MSISSGNIGMIKQAASILGGRYDDIQVAELGNQKILAVGRNGKEYKKCTGKEWFENMGSRHTSFDMNAKDGAIPLDLCATVPDKYVNVFDMLTNYGTTEHVEKQKKVFENIHRMVRSGGVMVHSIPLDGFWRGHCPYHYTKDFPDELAKLNGYTLMFKQIQDRNKNKLLNFILVRSDAEFVGIPSGTITFSKNYKQNTDNLF